MRAHPDRFEYEHSKELRKLGDVEGLVEALGHPDVQKSRHLRGHVVRDLGELTDQRAVPALIEVLEHDADVPIRVFAAEGLGRIDDARCLPALQLAMGDLERAVRLGAIRSVGQLRDRGSVGHLIEYLDDEDSWIREYAVRALGEIGDQRATSALLARLDDPNDRVRKAAASSLVALGDWNAIEPLRDAHARAGLFGSRALKRALRELEDRFR